MSALTGTMAGLQDMRDPPLECIILQCGLPRGAGSGVAAIRGVFQRPRPLRVLEQFSLQPQAAAAREPGGASGGLVCWLRRRLRREAVGCPAAAKARPRATRSSRGAHHVHLSG